MTEATGRYLFAVARGLDPASGGLGTAWDDAPVTVVEQDGLQAVVCDVDLAEFGEEPLREHLEDLAWLERVARLHHDVVFRAASLGTVAPARLVTICADDASVRDRVRALREPLTSALDHVAGRGEVSVKVYAAPADAVPAQRAGDGETPTPGTGASAGEGAGAAYLRRKRDQATARREAGERSAATAAAIDAAFAAATIDARRLQPQDPRLTGRAEPMLLNAAYLVDLDRTDAVADLLARVREEHPEVTVELEGPWPPYSFATLEDA